MKRFSLFIAIGAAFTVWASVVVADDKAAGDDAQQAASKEDPQDQRHLRLRHLRRRDQGRAQHHARRRRTAPAGS